MNIFQNINNMYNEDPIKIFMIIAIIYLIFNSMNMNINENFKLSTVENDVNLTALSVISQIVPRFEKAFSIDNDGNITFKKDFKVIGKSEFDKDIRIKRRAKFSPANSTDDPKGTYALYGFNRGNKRGLEIANLITSTDTKVGNQKEGDWKGTPFSIRHDVNRNQENDLEVNGTVGYKHLTKTNQLKKNDKHIVSGAEFNLYTPWFEANCNNDEYMCGVNARIEDDQGSDDDSGMNGMKISCCKF